MNPNALPFRHRNLWRFRWLQIVGSRSSTLHRLVVRKSWDREGKRGIVGASGWSACWINGAFAMPGIFSRMGAPRCKKCCRALGIEPGNGAPFNAGIREPGCQGPKKGRTGKP